MAAPEIQVVGLKELRKSLRGFETDTSWRPALKSAYVTVARDVEQRAVARSASSRMGSAARATIQGKGTLTNATIKAGRGIVYYGGFEFGSHRFRQFPPTLQGGYHIYPAVDEARETIANDFMEEIDRALTNAQL